MAQQMRTPPLLSRIVSAMVPRLLPAPVTTLLHSLPGNLIFLISIAFGALVLVVNELFGLVTLLRVPQPLFNFELDVQIRSITESFLESNRSC